jgi:RND superfamily putative drug exporter
VLLWQDLFGIQVQWLVMLMSVIILLAVGSDYNLLLVSRFQDEIHAGLKTGIIRSMAGTGGVVTSAGLVFAATMAGMMASKLIVLAQMGSTIAIGLLIDTFIVRSLLMPSIAVLLGRWFWWPQVVHPRGRYNTEKFVPKAFQQSHQEQVSAGAAGRSGFVDDAPTDSYPTSTA